MVDYSTKPFRQLRYDTMFYDWEMIRAFFIECYFSGKVKDLDGYKAGDFILSEEGRIYYDTDCVEEIFQMFPSMRCQYRVVHDRVWGREEGLCVILKNPESCEEKGYYVFPPICVVGNTKGKNKNVKRLLNDQYGRILDEKRILQGR